MRGRQIIVSVVVFGLISACGGSSDGGPTTTGPEAAPASTDAETDTAAPVTEPAAEGTDLPEMANDPAWCLPVGDIASVVGEAVKLNDQYRSYAGQGDCTYAPVADGTVGFNIGYTYFEAVTQISADNAMLVAPYQFEKRDESGYTEYSNNEYCMRASDHYVAVVTDNTRITQRIMNQEGGDVVIPPGSFDDPACGVLASLWEMLG